MDMASSFWGAGNTACLTTKFKAHEVSGTYQAGLRMGGIRIDNAPSLGITNSWVLMKDTVMAVSYTHLDVYKRQAYTDPNGTRPYTDAELAEVLSGDFPEEIPLRQAQAFRLAAAGGAEMCIRDSSRPC